MKERDSVDAIPRDVTLRLCEKIRKENRGQWYRWTAWMCWGCETFCKGDPEKMCVASQADYRGCMQVNARYDQRLQQAN